MNFLKTFSAIVCLFGVWSFGALAEDVAAASRSIELLKTLAGVEISIVKLFRRFLRSGWEENEELLSRVRSYIEDFEDSTSTIPNLGETKEEKAEAISSNPIALLRMLFRLTDEYPVLAGLLKKPDGRNVIPSMDKAVNTEDTRDAIIALFRVALAYGFSVKDMADGKIGGEFVGSNLQAVHCYQIGLIAFHNSLYTIGFEFLELAYKKAEMDKTVDRVLVKNALRELIQKHDAVVYASTSNPKQVIDGYTANLTSLKNLRNRNLRFKIRDVLKQEVLNGTDGDKSRLITYWTLCEHGDLQTEAQRKELFCWYEHRSHPFWRLQPLKVELLAKNPQILQIYNVISDSKISLIKSVFNRGEKESAGVFSAAKGGHLSTVRTSTVSWVEGEDLIPELRDLGREIGMITGLDVSRGAAEDLQIGTYTFGGHYKNHVDSFGNTIPPRIATFMLYLHTPKMGGNTAFILARTAARPVKGSAVFWHNLYSDGETDMRTLHAACPVALGQKWVANKWIKYEGQELNRKCGRRKDRRYELFDIPSQMNKYAE